MEAAAGTLPQIRGAVSAGVGVDVPLWKVRETFDRVCPAAPRMGLYRVATARDVDAVIQAILSSEWLKRKQEAESCAT